MKLYVMRHGEAVDVGEMGVKTDGERMLSPRGREQTCEVAKGLATLGIHPGSVGTSPLVRAKETADIVAQEICTGDVVEECEFLKPGGKTSHLIKWLEQRTGDSAMIVGHMPDLSRMIAELIGGRANANIEMKKAGVAFVSFDGKILNGMGILRWLLIPEQLIRMARHC